MYPSAASMNAAAVAAAARHPVRVIFYLLTVLFPRARCKNVGCEDSYASVAMAQAKEVPFAIRKVSHVLFHSALESGKCSDSVRVTIYMSENV